MADLIGRWMRHKLPKWLKSEVWDMSRQAKTWPAKYFPAVCVKDREEKGYYVIMHSEAWEAWFGDRILKMLEENDGETN